MNRSPATIRIRAGFDALARAKAPDAPSHEVASAFAAADRAVVNATPETLPECLSYLDLILANDRDTIEAVPRHGLTVLRSALSDCVAKLVRSA